MAKKDYMLWNRTGTKAIRASNIMVTEIVEEPDLFAKGESLIFIKGYTGIRDKEGFCFGMWKQHETLEATKFLDDLHELLEEYLPCQTKTKQ
jgi:hypothetical protein